MIDRRTSVLGVSQRDETPAQQPCLRCGRPAPQPGGRLSGLSGQVVQAFEVVDRMEQVAEALRQALHVELTSGVERHVASVRADAAAVIVSAHAERDLARQEADAVRGALAATRRDLVRVDENGRRLRQAVQGLQAELARVRDEADTAGRDVAAARAELTAEQATAAAERARLVAERESLLAARDASAAEHAAALSALSAERDQAAAAAEELREALAEARAARDTAQAHLTRVAQAVAAS